MNLIQSIILIKKENKQNIGDIIYISNKIKENDANENNTWKVVCILYILKLCGKIWNIGLKQKNILHQPKRKSTKKCKCLRDCNKFYIADNSRPLLIRIIEQKGSIKKKVFHKSQIYRHAWGLWTEITI